MSLCARMTGGEELEEFKGEEVSYIHFFPLKMYVGYFCVH